MAKEPFLVGAGADTTPLHTHILVKKNWGISYQVHAPLPPPTYTYVSFILKVGPPPPRQTQHQLNYKFSFNTTSSYNLENEFSSLETI